MYAIDISTYSLYTAEISPQFATIPRPCARGSTNQATVPQKPRLALFSLTFSQVSELATKHFDPREKRMWRNNEIPGAVPGDRPANENNPAANRRIVS
jgi:hypothetical protein